MNVITALLLSLIAALGSATAFGSSPQSAARTASALPCKSTDPTCQPLPQPTPTPVPTLPPGPHGPGGGAIPPWSPGSCPDGYYQEASGACRSFLV
ncbi:MAG TPA: hypothetical protein VK665_04665 [Candidatus Elarobacter sp.]|nr:hypothetical protein [Candidatus Elarobacter sp.]